MGFKLAYAGLGLGLLMMVVPMLMIKLWDTTQGFDKHWRKGWGTWSTR